MEENEGVFFMSNAHEPPSQSSKSLSNSDASYIRDWKTEGACAQLYLSRLQFNKFIENNKKNSTNKYSPPKFRYRYLKEVIILYLINNGQIFIPLRALKCIEKGINKEVKMILREDKKKLIEYNWNDNYTHGKKIAIKENIRASNYIFLKFHDDVSIKEIDIVGLHIDHLINKNSSRISLSPNNESSWYSNWGLLKDDNKELIIKFHINDEIRIFLFDYSLQFQEIKERIEKTCKLQTIRKLKYKDNEDEFITISSHEEFRIAYSLYSKNKKLEMWYFQ